jgi:hypothetical protein
MPEKIPPMTDADRSFVPPAVARAAAAADAMVTGTPPGNPAAPPPVVIPPTAPVAAPVAPAAPPPVVIPPAAPPPVPLAEATDAEVDAFLSAPSEPGSEMARMQQSIRTMRGRLSASDKRLAALHVAPAPVVAPPVLLLREPEAVPDLNLPQELVETYGADLIDVMHQVANHTAKQVRADLLREIGPALSSVATSAVVSRQDAAKQFVDTQLQPFARSFDSVDTDPQFVEWLKLTDPMTGATRNQLFMDAWQKADAGRLTFMMKSYLSEVAPLAASAPTPAPVVPAAPPAPAPRQVVPLENLAAPGRGPTSSPPAAPQSDDTGTITRHEIRTFYTRKQRGDFKGRDQEVADTEAMIAKASAEGRVIG